MKITIAQTFAYLRRAGWDEEPVKTWWMGMTIDAVEWTWCGRKLVLAGGPCATPSVRAIEELARLEKRSIDEVVADIENGVGFRGILHGVERLP